MSVAIPANLITTVRDQNAVLFLGAGASVGAEHPRGFKVPTGRELRDAIADRFLGGALKDRSLAEVSELAASESSLVDVQSFIREIYIDFGPSEFHRLIASFRWHGIASTNLDTIVEKAYDETRDRLQELVPFLKNGQPVEIEMKRHINGVQFLKLHGSISTYADSDIPFILATEQYVKYRENRTRLFARLEEWGTEFPIIFCGYSIADPNIQNILFDLFDLGRKRPPYYVVLPTISPIEARYWTSRRVFPIESTFQDFLEALDSLIPLVARKLPVSLGGGTSTLRTHFTLASATESANLLAFLENDVWHVRPGMPAAPANPKEFYKGFDDGWAAISADLDVPRSVTDSLLVDGVLLDEEPDSRPMQLLVAKGAAGNGKTIALKRAAWMAANDFGKLVLYARPGGTLRPEAIEEIARYTDDRIFLFVDRTSTWLEELLRLIEFAEKRSIRITIVTAEREAEWNVRCEPLETFVSKEFSVRYLSEREIRGLLRKLEIHGSLGLLIEIPFEDRVRAFTERAQRQLLVALHETTLGKPFEEIISDEFQRIVPAEAQTMYLDICSLNRLGAPVRAGLISRISGIAFDEFKTRLFRPLEYIVIARKDKYSSDWIYAARHQRVAEIVFDRQLSHPEQKYDQLIRVVRGMNIDYSSDKAAFDQLIRGHTVKDTFKSQELGRRFFDVAMEISGGEAYVFQQRGIFEMEHQGGDLRLAENYLQTAAELDPFNRTIQHTRANLARRQALAATNPIVRKQLRDAARARLSGLTSDRAEQSHGFHTAAQIALDELKDILEIVDQGSSDPLLDKQLVEAAREVEKYLLEGNQRFPLNEHLLTLEADYRTAMNQSRAAETALKKAFAANPRLDWIAGRLSKALVEAGDILGAFAVLRRSIQENPSSKRSHFELAMLLTQHGNQEDRATIAEHLRRAFTQGDQNYEAQFWYARELFLSNQYITAKELFQQLRKAEIPPKAKNELRGIVGEADGGPRRYRGVVGALSESYLFVHVDSLPDDVFAHRSRVPDDTWTNLSRGSIVEITLGFNMRGPAAASLRTLPH